MSGPLTKLEAETKMPSAHQAVNRPTLCSGTQLLHSSCSRKGPENFIADLITNPSQPFDKPGDSDGKEKPEIATPHQIPASGIQGSLNNCRQEGI
jgi:hypothetical protein